MSNSTINLAPFCGQGDMRVAMNCLQPFPGGAVACNGHIIIFAEGAEAGDVPEGCALAPERRTNYEEILRIASAHDFAQSVQATSLLLGEYPKCKRCHGAGKVHESECDECDGDGYFSHGSHEYECKNCDNSGVVDCDPGRTDATTCQECLGSGVKPTCVLFGDVASNGISTNYVHLLHGLPDCVISRANENQIAFRFSGGYGIVMAMQGPRR